MAPIAAYLMQQGSGISIKQVVTFAAPRSGNGGFQTGYQSVFKNHIRYENYGDLVPLLPPSDEFVGLLAKAVAYIPDIGSDLSKLISEAAGWDYTPVGSELFIESAANHLSDQHERTGYRTGFRLHVEPGAKSTGLGNSARKCSCNWLRIWVYERHVPGERLQRLMIRR